MTTKIFTAEFEVFTGTMKNEERTDSKVGSHKACDVTLYIPTVALGYACLDLSENLHYKYKRTDRNSFEITFTYNSRHKKFVETKYSQEQILNIAYAERLGSPRFDAKRQTIVVFASKNKLRFEIPERVKRNNKGHSRAVEKDDRLNFFDMRTKYTGTAYAAVLNANRHGNVCNPVELKQLLELLRENGHRITRVNDRLWLFDDKTVITADLVECANKLQKGLVLTAA